MGLSIIISCSISKDKEGKQSINKPVLIELISLLSPQSTDSSVTQALFKLIAEYPFLHLILLQCHKFICSTMPVVKYTYKQENIINRLFTDEFYFYNKCNDLDKFYQFNTSEDNDYLVYDLVHKNEINMKDLIIIYSSIYFLIYYSNSS